MNITEQIAFYTVFALLFSALKRRARERSLSGERVLKEKFSIFLSKHARPNRFSSKGVR
jgi:hypothetical protein